MALTGTIPPPAPAGRNTGWTLSGQAQAAGSDLQLTAAGAGRGAGAAFYGTPLRAGGLRIAFTTSMSGGSGGGGIALVLADPTQTSAAALGGHDGGFGFVGIPGTALILSTDFNNPPGSASYAAISVSTLGATGAPSYLATSTAVPALRPGTHAWSVTVSGGVMSVTCDGISVLTQAVTLGPSVLVGFTAANSALDDTHIVRSVAIATAPTALDPYLFDVRVYGALGDGRMVADGAITSGTNTLACATSVPFKASDVGKTILVRAAGPSGVSTLVTSITGYTDAGHVTLAANASATASATIVAWATDDTPAFQAAETAASTYAQANPSASVRIVGPPGIYGIFGPLVTGGTTLGCAQIPLHIPPVTGNKVDSGLECLGELTAATGAHWQQLLPQATGMVLLSSGVFAGASAQSTKLSASGNPAVIGGPTQPNHYGDSNLTFSNMNFTLKGVTIITPLSTSGWNYCGADFSGLAQATVRDCNIGVLGTYVGNDFLSPSTFSAGLSKGLLLPANGNNDLCDVQGLSIWGGYTWGLFATEHTVARNVRLLYCWSAMAVIGAYFGSVGAGHAVFMDQVSIEGCSYEVYLLGQGAAGLGPYLDVIQMDTESAAPSFRDANDGALGAARGRIRLTGLYTPSAISTTNPTGLEIINGQQAPGPATAPTYTLGTAFQNTFWKWATVTLAGGTVTAVKIGATMGGASAPTMTALYSQASGTLPLITVRVPPGGWLEIDGTVAPTTNSWVLD